MGEFFCGWKRKLGVATLLLACLFMMGWVRSFYANDFFGWGIFPVVPVWLGSVDSTIFLISENPINFSKFSPSLSMWHSVPYQPIDQILEKVDLDIRLAGFGYYRAVFQGILIPYWSIVLPLTALSAWLLLSKSRKPAPQPLADRRITQTEAVPPH